MLTFYVGGEQETEDGFLAINLSSSEDVVSPECVVEAIIDSLLGMSSFLGNHKGAYRGIIADFSVELPEDHNPKNYIGFEKILENMEHQRVVDFYNEYCGSDCFETADEDSGCVWYSFTLFPPASPVNEEKIWEYYKNHIL